MEAYSRSADAPIPHNAPDQTTSPTSSNQDAGGYARSSYAVKAEILKGIPGMVKALGMRSLAQLLSFLVTRQDEVVAALKPFTVDFLAKANGNAEDQIARKALQAKLKTMRPNEVKRLLELLGPDAIQTCELTDSAETDDRRP